MKAVTLGFRMMDGRTQPTKLIALLKNRFGIGMFDQILDRIYCGRIGVEEIAELAFHVQGQKEVPSSKPSQSLRETGEGGAYLVAAKLVQGPKALVHSDRWL